MSKLIASYQVQMERLEKNDDFFEVGKIKCMRKYKNTRTVYTYTCEHVRVHTHTQISNEILEGESALHVSRINNPPTPYYNTYSVLFQADKNISLYRNYIPIQRLNPNISLLELYYFNSNTLPRGAWVAWSVKRLTLDLGSGHDVTVMGSSPTSGSALSMEPS